MVSMISQSDAVVMCGIACVGSLLVWNKDKWDVVIAKRGITGANNRATRMTMSCFAIIITIIMTIIHNIIKMKYLLFYVILSALNILRI